MAFRLYDTYGFPLDLTEDVLRGQGRPVDAAGFDVAMERQRAEARKSWTGSGSAAAPSDAALLRPGRLDRKIEIPEPNETQRLEILKIHSQSITKRGNIDWESVVKLADGLNGADMRNICTEAGLFAIRSDRDYCLEEDFMKAARKILDNKKLESKLDYSKV